jgi:HPt (histidine-containing phosphotransfer) domain-containing protein
LLRELHSLKGAASTVCAALLASRAAVLETALRGDATAGGVNVAPLMAAFDAWRVAVSDPGVVEAEAAGGVAALFSVGPCA